ncbi:MAG: AMP-binding protein, partial [Alphaproteobacteria bacterium]|nr:AMP-binding protein [Alphaproteobacteria bacterium]
RWVEKEAITGLAAVPPLWLQLIKMDWPESAATTLRYLTNSGGRMPYQASRALREALPETKIFLMYGLTEAFRSTYLDPDEVDARPDSIGKAIPFAELHILKSDGTLCAPFEAGELVHAGPLVAKGYWQDEARTKARFRPLPEGVKTDYPGQPAVFSGDTVFANEDGFLYFVGRDDAMIKSSGYRISPEEVEEVLYEIPGIAEALAVGVPHDELGQAVVAVIAGHEATNIDSEAVLKHCRAALPAFMVPRLVIVQESLPRNPNGKLDRACMADDLKSLFESG